MPLTAREAFKVGFLARCAEMGLGRNEIATQIKTAEAKLANLLTDALSGVLSTSLPLAALAPPIIGGVAGYGAARLGDINDTDVDEVKDRELLDTYRTETGKLRRQKQFRDRRAGQRRPLRPLY